MGGPKGPSGGKCGPMRFPDASDYKHNPHHTGGSHYAPIPAAGYGVSHPSVRTRIDKNDPCRQVSPSPENIPVSTLGNPSE